MLTKMFAVAHLARTLRSCNSIIGTRCMGSYQVGEAKTAVQIAKENKATYNDLPQPEGDYWEEYNKRQGKMNAMLVASLLFFVGTLAAMAPGGVYTFNILPNVRTVKVDAYRLGGIPEGEEEECK